MTARNLRDVLPGAIQRTRQDALMATVQGRRGLVVDPADLADLLVAAEAWLEGERRRASEDDTRERVRRAELRDDIEWLTGTGRFGQ